MEKDAFPFWTYWLSVHQVVTYGQQHIVSQLIQIYTSTLDQNTLYSINNQWLTLFSNDLKNFPPQPKPWTVNWSMWNGLSCWMVTPNGWIKTKEGTTQFTQPTWERLSNEFWRDVVCELFIKPMFKPSTVLSSGRDTVPASKRWGIIYEIPCRDCEHKYIGEMKRSPRSSLVDRKNSARTHYSKNILLNPEQTALTKHASQSGHCFNWYYAHVLHHVK